MTESDLLITKEGACYLFVLDEDTCKIIMPRGMIIGERDYIMKEWNRLRYGCGQYSPTDQEDDGEY